jgi:hypothetical protein
MKERLQDQGRITRKERFRQWFCDRRGKEAEPRLDPNDPFAAEREDLMKLITRQPKWLTDIDNENGDPPPTWYVGPRGPDFYDVMNASDEESAKYLRLAEMIKHDDAKKKHDRLFALGYEPEPFSWELYQNARQNVASEVVE